MKSLKENIEATTEDLIAGFLYYDRKEDELLPRGAIEEAVANKVISIEEIVAIFEHGLRSNLR